MRVSGLGIVIQLDIVGLGAADDLFLLLGAQLVPLGQVVDIFLNGDVGATGVIGVVAKQHGIQSLLGEGIGGAIHKA